MRAFVMLLGRGGVGLLAPSLIFAQMPGVPVLQNAWATPGIVAAVNVGGGSGSAVWAGALSWAPGGARLQLSGGVGMGSAGGSSRSVYGVRAAMPLMSMMGDKVGVAAFVGVGGGAGADDDSTQASTTVPAGVGVGYKQALGTRGFSVYATPHYRWTSSDAGSSGAFRASVGLDFALTSRIGVTGGLEFGGGGGGGTLYGIGGSFAFGSR